MDKRRIEPGPGQESVWDYPRPPAVQQSTDRIRIVLNGQTIVDTSAAVRVLETSHPPVYYVPPTSVAPGVLTAVEGNSFCEYKGQASYFDVLDQPRAAWYYPSPSAGFEVLTDFVAFYPGRVDACFVNDEQVVAQAGDFYGGWITSRIVGPFKGQPGTWGW